LPAAIRVAAPVPAARVVSETYSFSAPVARPGGMGGGNFEEILNSMFGGAARGARPGGGGQF